MKRILELGAQPAKRLGFRKRRSGDWVMWDTPINPGLEMLLRHGPGHTCWACRGFFRSKTQREQYCPSCKGIIDSNVKDLTAILQSAAKGPIEQSRSAIIPVHKALVCTFPTGPVTHCGWQANQGRSEPKNISMVVEYLRRWVEKAHCHHMRHVFWNRFPFGKKFFPFVASKEEKEQLYREYYDSKWNRKLDRILGTPAVKIEYPEGE